MLDSGTIQIVGAALFLAPVAGAAVVGRAVMGPRDRTVVSRHPARRIEAAWLGTIAVVQLWTLGVALLPGWFYAAPSPGDFPGSTVVQVIGLFLWAAAGGLAIWAIRTLGRFMTVSVQVVQGQPIVQGGPYAFVRHPTYTAVTAFAFGLALVFLSVPLLFVSLLLAALARYRGRLEEDFLRSPRAFGGPYEAYMARTGRFLPRIRRSGP